MQSTISVSTWHCVFLNNMKVDQIKKKQEKINLEVPHTKKKYVKKN